MVKLMIFGWIWLFNDEALYRRDDAPPPSEAGTSSGLRFISGQSGVERIEGVV